jgi:hypothetical protein
VYADGTVVHHVPETKVFLLENYHHAATFSEGINDIGRTLTVFYPPEGNVYNIKNLKK